MSNSKYIFKYNQDGKLYNYIELDKTDRVVSYFKIKDNTLIRYDKTTDTKQLITFKNKIELKQKFIGGNSFISVFDIKTDECIQHEMSQIEKKITLIKNNIYVSDYGKFIVNKWKDIKNKSGNIQPKLTSQNTILNKKYDKSYEEYWSTLKAYDKTYEEYRSNL